MDIKFPANANPFHPYDPNQLVTIGEGDPESKLDRDPSKINKSDLLEVVKHLKQRNDEIWYLIDQSQQEARAARENTYRECARVIRCIASNIDTTKMIGNDVVDRLLSEAKEWEA